MWKKGCLCQATLKFLARYTTIKEQHQINEEIRDREVRVISAEGEQLGIMSAAQALVLAEEADLDLVKISPNAVPPVCKIMNYGKYLFELTKKAKEAKKNQKVTEIKEVWLSMTIDVGDLNVKAKQTQKFLMAGNKVKVSIRMRGRQMAHSELGLEVMTKFYELVKDFGTMEKNPLTEGRNIWMMLAPTKA
jgi:translation initiation factor IF-3